jgi:hypothetical protein
MHFLLFYLCFLTLTDLYYQDNILNIPILGYNKFSLTNCG